MTDLKQHFSPRCYDVVWQVFRGTENAEKSRKLRTKWKIVENSVFATQNKKYPRKSLFLEYF